MLPKIKTILYATALETGGPHVFRYALSLAQQYQARIVILHALEPLSKFGQSLVELHMSHQESEKMHQEARETVRADIEARLHQLCEAETCQAQEGRKLVAAIQVLEGQPSEVIIDQARTLSADLIVMGTHRTTVLGDAVLGHTANKVMHRSEIPVLLVRIPAGFGKEEA